jgi:valacyclovir hydrolase
LTGFSEVLLSHMPYAAVNEQRLWYEDAGQGEAVLMLHGFTGTARSDLGVQIDYFGPFFRVIAPDLRGYGRSEPKPRMFGPDFYVQDALDVGALLDVLGIDQAHVLGYSDGAESAILAAIERPDRVRSVVAWGLTGVLGPEIENVADNFLPVSEWPEKRPDWTAEIVANHSAEWLVPMVEGWSAAIKQIVAAGGDVSLGLAHEIRCPVLLINGEHDTGNPEHLARQLAERIPDCTFEIWPGLGHPVHKEAPEAFQARVLAFLRARA